MAVVNVDFVAVDLRSKAASVRRLAHRTAGRVLDIGVVEDGSQSETPLVFLMWFLTSEVRRMHCCEVGASPEDFGFDLR